MRSRIPALTFSFTLHILHKESDSSVMNYRQNEMTAIQTHILYLIDLVVYYLCLVRLHNSPAGKKKRQQHEKKNTRRIRKSRRTQAKNKMLMQNHMKKAKRSRNEKISFAILVFIVHCFTLVVCYCCFKSINLFTFVWI